MNIDKKRFLALTGVIAAASGVATMQACTLTVNGGDPDGAAPIPTVDSSSQDPRRQRLRRFVVPGLVDRRCHHGRRGRRSHVPQRRQDAEPVVRVVRERSRHLVRGLPCRSVVLPGHQGALRERRLPRDHGVSQARAHVRGRAEPTRELHVQSPRPRVCRAGGQGPLPTGPHELHAVRRHSDDRSGQVRAVLLGSLSAGAARLPELHVRGVRPHRDFVLFPPRAVSPEAP
jgi:hypothetical protein